MTILEFVQKKPDKVLVRCDCGVEKIVFLCNITPRIKGRYTVSCGCKQKQLLSEKKTKHGMSGKPFYKRWRSMFDRLSANYIDSKSYTHVTICDRWKSFENFKEDMFDSFEKHCSKNGEKNTTLDRIDVFSGYSNENCRWATNSEQSLNKKNTLYVIYNNKKIPMKSLCDKFNLKYDTFRARINNGFSVEQAISNKPWTRVN